MTSIINISLQTDTFPKAFKHGLVTPLLKKPGLDREVLSNYRPITNLSFISKVLERIVANQLDNPFSDHDILSPSQPVYRAYHSTETALLSFQNDLILSVGRGRGCVILLADFTAVFDTIDHELLLYRLNVAFLASLWPGLTTI